MANALTDPLCTVPQVKDALKIQATDAEDDDRLERAVEAATRQIHQRCDRNFTQTTTASARVFIASDCNTVRVDDFHTTTGLVVKTDTSSDGTFDTTWTSGTDYQLHPLNGVVSGITGWPYDKIQAVGAKSFPVDAQAQARVEVTAQWGWANIPDDVREACIIQSAHIFKAADAALGTAGFGEFGVVRIRQALHPTAETLIARYARHPIPVA